ncbi:MAG: signal peptidase II [Caldiserica bacterium]|nr:signal peptidase II [Caldisericota bacterium]
MRTKLLPFALAGLVLAVDQLLKHLVVSALAPGESFALLPGVLYLSRVHNTGSAFGILRGRNPLLAVLVAAVSLGVVWALQRGVLRGRWERVGGGLVLGGALGNLLDRLIRGYVVDYVDFRLFPAFNLADASVVVGALLLAVGMLWRRG